MAQNPAHVLRPAKTGYLPTLDGWRAIAIFMVLCCHTRHWSHAIDILHIPLNCYGYLGVDLFFALSGILICHRLLEEERTFGRISLKNFYIRRTFRILPPAYFYLGVVALLGLMRILPAHWPTWWSALLFFRNYTAAFLGDGESTLYSGHFWSLAVEEHFYLLLPALLILFPRWRKSMLLGATGAAFAWMAIYAKLTPLALRDYNWMMRSDLHFASLLFPAFLAVVLQSARARRALARLLHPAIIPVCLLALITAKYVDKRMHPELDVSQRVARYTPAPPLNARTHQMDASGTDESGRPIFPIIHFRGRPVTALTFAVPLLAPLLILSTLLRPRSLLGRFLELAPMRYVGRLSYSLYLWQQFFWGGESKGWPIFALQSSPVICALLTLGVAMASFYLIERPLIRLGHRLAPPATEGHRDIAANESPRRPDVDVLAPVAQF